MHLSLLDNDFFGKILQEISTLHHLLCLDLSTDNLRGLIPSPPLANLTHFITLHLQNNEISGPIPNFISSPPPNLTDLNLSNNKLYGFLPDSLISRYRSRTFAGNQSQCSEIPFSPIARTPTDNHPMMVMTSPSSLPPSWTAAATNSTEKHRKNLGNGAIVAIAAASVSEVVRLKRIWGNGL